MNTYDGILDQILSFFHEHGVNPIYVITLVCIVVTFSYFRNAGRWSRVPKFWRPLFIGTLFATVVLIIISIMELTT
jgi:hypothetical protein